MCNRVRLHQHLPVRGDQYNSYRPGVPGQVPGTGHARTDCWLVTRRPQTKGSDVPFWIEEPLFLCRIIFKIYVHLKCKWQELQMLKFGKHGIRRWGFLSDCARCMNT